MPSRTPDSSRQVIYLHTEAPRKPAPGQACNGCGVCCATEPCPVGQVISRRTRGACAALLWSAPERLYRCGLVCGASTLWPGLPGWLESPLAWLARRWISAASGCDATLEAEVGT